MKYRIHFDNGKELDWETIATDRDIKTLMIDKQVVVLCVGIVDFNKVSYVTIVG